MSSIAIDVSVKRGGGFPLRGLTKPECTIGLYFTSRLCGMSSSHFLISPSHLHYDIRCCRRLFYACIAAMLALAAIR